MCKTISLEAQIQAWTTEYDKYIEQHWNTHTPRKPCSLEALKRTEDIIDYCLNQIEP